MEVILTTIVVISIVALIYSLFLAAHVKNKKMGNAKMKEIAKAIQEGAMAFLFREYKVITIFIIVFGFIIGLFLDLPATPNINEGWWTALAFVLGSIVSLLAGYIGMRIATVANVRTAHASTKSLSEGFKVAFNGGAVMGISLVSFAVLGLAVLYYIFAIVLGYPEHSVMEIITGFGLGGSSIALFSRVGGGIYTKAADVGADLVGKVEKGIPEDDPRNPAVIADNVGDNVGDVAGMGADLFGSAAESTCAALVIGVLAFAGMKGALLYPILISAIGIVLCIISLWFVRVKSNATEVETPLKVGLILSSVLVAIVMYFVTMALIPETFELLGKTYHNWGVYVALLSGLIAGLFTGVVTEYFTSHRYKPVREVAKASKTGPATNIIYGLSLGYESAVVPVLLLASTVFLSYSFAGLYGVAIAALGMLSTLVVGLTIDAYGPISDNAGGIAEMAGLGKNIRARTDTLDAAGNTTAAIGKGFAIGSAALTGLALFSAFTLIGGVNSLDLLSPIVISGLLVGAMLPFFFSAMTMKSVGKAAFSMINEVRRQFKTIKGIMQGKAKPDYRKCVDISTSAALKEMIAPGLLVILTPIIVGLLFGMEALAGLLMGSLVSGVVMATSLANSGGAWDNAKKYIETGALGGKGSAVHKAAVVGDTVGDPAKDTSGPSLNILIKLMSIISLVFVPLFVKYGGILIG